MHRQPEQSLRRLVIAMQGVLSLLVGSALGVFWLSRTANAPTALLLLLAPALALFLISAAARRYLIPIAQELHANFLERSIRNWNPPAESPFRDWTHVLFSWVIPGLFAYLGLPAGKDFLNQLFEDLRLAEWATTVMGFLLVFVFYRYLLAFAANTAARVEVARTYKEHPERFFNQGAEVVHVRDVGDVTADRGTQGTDVSEVADRIARQYIYGLWIAGVFGEAMFLIARSNHFIAVFNATRGLESVEGKQKSYWEIFSSNPNVQAEFGLSAILFVSVILLFFFLHQAANMFVNTAAEEEIQWRLDLHSADISLSRSTLVELLVLFGQYGVAFMLVVAVLTWLIGRAFDPVLGPVWKNIAVEVQKWIS